MMLDAPLSFEQGKRKILDAIGEPRDLTFVRGFGNVGDLLIHAGVRQLLSGLDYREVSILDLGDAGGDTAVYPGAGGFCHAYHKNPACVAELEKRFERVIVLPSSFDMSVETVRSYVRKSRAHLFARERESFRQIQNMCRADLAHDCAFYFNFEPYRRTGKGTLIACRTDRESTRQSIPINNNDISRTCETLDEFLWTIAMHELIRTDRAHVMVAAAMLGKRVEYWPSNYHKLRAIAEFSLATYPVKVIDPGIFDVETSATSQAAVAEHERNPHRLSDWVQWIHLTACDFADYIPKLSTCILVDNCQLGELPVHNRLFLHFLERNGEYAGNPADSREAINELERLRRQGADFVAIAWTACWWLDTYSDFISHLRTHYTCRLENERIILFDLRAHSET
jgi:hypothetical protein